MYAKITVFPLKTKKMTRNVNILPVVLKDMRVKLAELFDQNFREQGFFGAKWRPKKVYSKGGSPTVLIVTGAMRRGIRSEVRGRSVVFTSDKPYTALHNEGGTFQQNVPAHYRNVRERRSIVRAHTRNMHMPQRQFIGDHAKVQNAIGSIMTRHLERISRELTKLTKI